MKTSIAFCTVLLFLLFCAPQISVAQDTDLSNRVCPGGESADIWTIDQNKALGDLPAETPSDDNGADTDCWTTEFINYLLGLFESLSDSGN